MVPLATTCAQHSKIFMQRVPKSHIIHQRRSQLGTNIRILHSPREGTRQWVARAKVMAAAGLPPGTRQAWRSPIRITLRGKPWLSASLLRAFPDATSPRFSLICKCLIPSSLRAFAHTTYVHCLQHRKAWCCRRPSVFLYVTKT